MSGVKGAQVELPIAAADRTAAATPVAAATAAAQPATSLSQDEWRKLARRARWLSWASLAYMGVEGAVAIAAGLVAGSIALIGFGV